jgi:hypothetical protein
LLHDTTARRIAIAVGVVVLVIAVAISIRKARDDSSAAAPKPLETMQGAADLRGSPPPLAGLHAHSSRLLSGDVATVKARLAAPRGWPVVVNKWASWCPPCKGWV